MAVPTDRESFKQYCLRSLGYPVLQMHLDDDQIEDRIDEALSYYWDFHFDGSERIYYKYVVQSADITNQYIPMPENINGVVKIFNYGDRFSNVNNLFGVQYQLALNELYMFNSYSMIPYYMGMQQLELIDQLLVGLKPIRYNRNVNKLYIDWDWSLINVGQYLLIEAFQVVDPTLYADVWKDRWLYKYCSQLIKRNLGTVLSKYAGVQLVGGITFNGADIYAQADAEIIRLEAEMQSTYSPVLGIIIG